MTLQDAAVAGVAIIGAAVLVRRLLGSLRSKNAACPSCASGAAACAKPAAPSPAPHDAH